VKPAAAVLRRWLPLALLAAAAGLAIAIDLHRQISFETLRDSRFVLRDWVDGRPFLAPLAFVATYVAVTAVSLPGATMMTLAGGFLFGTVAGGAYAVTGATLGAIAVFIAARGVLADRLRRRAGGALARLEDGFRRDAFSYLLVLRLVPLFPFFVVNLAAAFLGAPLRHFAAATLIGIVPGTLVFAAVGNGLGAVFDAGTEPDLSIMLSPPVMGPLVALALLALVPVAYRRFAGRR
jgi:uncharacterized membrane protein YdjX (TVP38/TMEM64 family)